MTSARIRLCFSSWPSPALHKTSFEHPLLGETTLCAVRGDRSTPESRGTFKWSKGVKALVTLLVLFKRDHLAPMGKNHGISGGAGSDAAALDYALSKKPRWLFDILGSTAEGMPLAPRLIDRVNPERKRPGPVTLLISPQRLNPQSIHIFVDEAELIAREELDHLLAALNQTPHPRVPVIVNSPIAPQNVDHEQTGRASRAWDHIVRDLVHREIARSLNNTDIFSRSRQLERAKRVTRHRFFSKLSRSNASIIPAIERKMTASERLGVRFDTLTLQRELERTKLTIACPACDVGTLAIFLFLKTQLGLNIEINYHYVHAIELVDSLVEGNISPDINLVLLGVAQLAYLLGKKQPEYELLIELPGISFGLIGTRDSVSNRPSKISQFLLLDDIRSNSAFYLDDTLNSLRIPATKHRKINKEPFEIAAHFAEPSCDERAVMFFPFLDFNCIFNDCQRLEVSSTVTSGSQNFLLAHRSIARNTKLARLLNGAIRYAWLSLSEESAIQRGITELIASDATFLKFMRRASGARYFVHHQSP